VLYANNCQLVKLKLDKLSVKCITLYVNFHTGNSRNLTAATNNNITLSVLFQLQSSQRAL